MVLHAIGFCKAYEAFVLGTRRFVCLCLSFVGLCSPSLCIVSVCTASPVVFLSDDLCHCTSLSYLNLHPSSCPTQRLNFHELFVVFSSFDAGLVPKSRWLSNDSLFVCLCVCVSQPVVEYGGKPCFALTWYEHRRATRGALLSVH